MKAHGRMVLLGIVAFLVAGPSRATGPDGSSPVAPTLFSPRHTPSRDLLPDRDVLWSQPPDLSGYKFLSEVIEDQGMGYRVADDFILPNAADITRVAFWGGPYLGSPGDPGPTSFNMQVLDNSSCSPFRLLLELSGVTPDRTFGGYDGNGDAVYRFETDLAFHAEASVRYWLVAQAVGDSYPPLWGRLQAAAEIECGAMYHDGWYWDWSECGNVLGYPFDASFELIDEAGPQGVCCYADGTCAYVVEQTCDETGGVWLGADFACEPDPCGQETGACCLPDMQCQIRSVADCLAAGGTWQGIGTTCHPDPCPPTPVERTTWGRIKGGYR